MNYLTELIIRPQRNIYNSKDLGDSTFIFSGQDFKRLDFIRGEVNKYFNYLLYILIFYLIIHFKSFILKIFNI